jgi:hypothetical protein
VARSSIPYERVRVATERADFLIKKGKERNMTSKKTTARAGSKKLKLKKEVIKDLDGKGKGKDVKGGQRPQGWTDGTARCTHDLFCPSAGGVC